MKNIGYKISDNLIRIIMILFGIMYAWFFINNVFNNSNDLIHYDMIKVCLLSCVILIGVIFISLVVKKYFNLIRNSKYKKCIYGVIIIGIFFAQFVITKLIYTIPGFDAGVLIEAGKNLVIDPSKVPQDYFGRFPNNVFLVNIFKNLYLLSSYLGIITYERLLVILNICCVDIAIVMSLVVSKKLVKNQSVFGTYLLFIALFAFSPWVIVAYSDTMSMMFPILILYIYIKSKECEKKVVKYILYVAIGIIELVAFQIKPTAIIILIAIVISQVLYTIRDKKSFKDILVFWLLVMVSFGGAKLIYNNTMANIYIDGVLITDNEDIEVPMTHFLMMGTKTRYIEDRGYLYGAWDGDDYNITYACSNKNEKIETNLAVYKKRVSDMGALGYLKYLSKKGSWMTSDGSFYSGGEGGNTSNYICNTELAQNVRNYLTFGEYGYKKFVSVLEAIWTVVLFLMVAASIFKLKDSEEILILKLCIIGITLFLLLFECRSRYLINHLPIMIVIASLGLDKIVEKVEKIKASLQQK